MSARIASEAERFFTKLVNDVRKAAGLEPLRLEQSLNLAAERHAEWMLATGTFAHTGANGSTWAERIREAGFDSSGRGRVTENLGVISIDGDGDLRPESRTLLVALLDSPSHRDSMLDPGYAYIGMGIETGTFEGQQVMMLSQTLGTTPDPVTLDSRAAVRGSTETSDAPWQTGSRRADRIEGGDGADRINGRGGPDRIEGKGGADHLRGGAGDDQLRGGRGHDTIEGGSGRDRVYLGDGRDTFLDDGTRGREGRDVVSGGDHNDVLTGRAGNDTLMGDRGADRVSGGDGQDRVEGGRGDDFLRGGKGDDSVLGQGGDDDLRLGRGDDRGAGGGGDDDISGGGGADRIFGGDGDDHLRGGNGPDRLEGQDGQDTLMGDGGFDRLDGGRGRDRLDGGVGDDTLTGGGGPDTFVFRDGGGADRITDFDVREDTLHLDTDLWSGRLTPADVVGQFGKVTAKGLVLDFGADRLTLDDLADTRALAAAIDLI